MTDPQSGRDDAMAPGRADGAAGAVQSSLDEDRREATGTDPQAGVDEGVQTNAEKDPDEWVTGEEPMTGPQESYLHTLAHEAGESVPDGLSKADASKEIDRLQSETGRGSG